MFTSCTTTFMAVSKSSLDAAVSHIDEEMWDRGYILTGQSDNTRNEVTVTGVTYSRYTGYGTAMKNNWWQTQEYVYTDSLDNSVSFTVKYQLKVDKNGREYVEGLEMTNCSASKNYKSVCGLNGVVRESVENVANKPGMEVTVSNPGATAAGILMGSLGFSAVILIICLCL